MKATLLVFVSFALFLTPTGIAAELPVGVWLVTEVDVFEPPFSKGVAGSLLDLVDLNADLLWPEENQEWHLGVEGTSRWTRVRAPGEEVPFASGPGRKLTLAATYLDAPRWTKARLVLEGDSGYRVFFDGKPLNNSRQNDLLLTRGKHRLLVAYIRGEDADGTLKATLEFEAPFDASLPTIETSPLHAMTLDELLEFPRFSATAVVLSADGSQVAILSRSGVLEIRSLPEGKLSQTIALPNPITTFAWSPQSDRLAMGVTGKETSSDIWLVDFTEGTTEKVFSEIKSISQLGWLPDGQFLTYVSRDTPKSELTYELVDDFTDRWDGWKARVSFWVASLNTKARRMVTGGISSYGWFGQAPVSPDGKTVAFVLSKPSSSYPFFEKQLWTVDLADGTAELVADIETSMITQMVWSPDSTRLAAIAPYYPYPTDPEDTVHSRWHQGVQIWDVKAKSQRYLTKPEFDPSVRSIWWNSKDRSLYFIALDRTVHRLFRFSPDLGSFAEVKLPFRNVSALYGGPGSEWVVISVDDVGQPSRLVSLHLESLEPRENPQEAIDSLKHVTLGKHEMFQCENREGTKLDGWIHLPPDFEPDRQYPLVVDYYGGVVPKTESFVPLNHWFAANGYVVYTMTPRGTWGYGQAFADAHINEWGTVSSPDIVDAVKALIEAKPFIDPERIGGIGRSYGGFEGLSLVTQTDLFATVVAGAVISNPINYSLVVLGQPNYGEIVLPGVYPWNRKDIYVDRAPVFNADKVTTPVLLMHGTEDPWTEMTESDQMFSALKLQGKDVFQIQWKGEAHGLAQPQNRRLYNQMVMEWLDKYLKDEPEGWNERVQKHPKKKPQGSTE